MGGRGRENFSFFLCARSTAINVQVPRKPPKSLLWEVVTFGDFNIWIYAPTILPPLRVFSHLSEGGAVHSTDFFVLESVFVLVCFFPFKAGQAEKIKPFLRLTMGNGGNISVTPEN